jgi:hypothetical protein
MRHVVRLRGIAGGELHFSELNPRERVIRLNAQSALKGGGRGGKITGCDSRVRLRDESRRGVA